MAGCELTGYIGYRRQLPKNCGGWNRDRIQLSKEFSIQVYGIGKYTGNGYANFKRVLGYLDKRILKYCRFIVNGNEVRYDSDSGEWFVRNWEKTHIPEYVDFSLKGKFVDIALKELERRRMKLRFQKTWLCVDLRRDCFCEDIIPEIMY